MIIELPPELKKKIPFNEQERIDKSREMEDILEVDHVQRQRKKKQTLYYACLKSDQSGIGAERGKSGF
jgi:hypothetical protein